MSSKPSDATELTFAERLRMIMEANGDTQNSVARALADRLDRNVAPILVSRWCRGSIPTGEYLLQLPDVLKCNGHWLLTGRGDMRAGVSGESDAYALGYHDCAAALQVQMDKVRLRVDTAPGSPPYRPARGLGGRRSKSA